MNTMSIDAMIGFLGKSSLEYDQNRVNGILTEIDFRRYVEGLGFTERVSFGGWIARSGGSNIYGHNEIVLFSEIIQPQKSYSPNRKMPDPPYGLHTISSILRQNGITSYYCSAIILNSNDAETVEWHALEIGVPSQKTYNKISNGGLIGFMQNMARVDSKNQNTKVSDIPVEVIAEEFSKASLRVSLQNIYMMEILDIDALFWGKQQTYLVEVGENAHSTDDYLGDYFIIDIETFIMFSHFTAKRGNLHSLFVVREIDDMVSRNLVNWWFITFEQLAQYASWTPIAGGKNMRGGGSSVVRIPKSEFTELKAQTLAQL